MSKNSALNEKIDKFILSNPKQLNEVGYYNRIAELFNIHPEKARKRWRMLQRQGALGKQKVIVKDKSYYVDSTVKNIQYADTNGENKTIRFDSKGTGYIQIETPEKIENLQDLVRVCKIDTEKYTISDYEVKAYNAWIKNADDKIETKQLFSVRANLKIKTVDNSINKQKELILAELKESSQVVVSSRAREAAKKIINALPEESKKDSALEINIPDLHIGKLAWGKETGEDYDINIAIERYKKAVSELISRVNIQTLEKIILPVGNDMINVDSKSNTTTAGTPQSCDSRFGKMFQTAKSLLIETIDMLSHISPVEVMIIPGNHDTVAMFTLGEVLDAWYHNNELVTVTNTHTPRKYIQYGVNGLMYTHGDKERIDNLGMIFATEQPQMWAATRFRTCKIGHFHKNKKINFVSVDEFPGFQVEIIPSLSGTDAWHAEKGYMSLKAAKAFLYHKEKGKIAEYTFNI
jgi:Icc-related predicted phosphoesterase